MQRIILKYILDGIEHNKIYAIADEDDIIGIKEELLDGHPSARVLGVYPYGVFSDRQNSIK